jgi:CubicO group peptidase (beta-lactamase class C family)
MLSRRALLTASLAALPRRAHARERDRLASLMQQHQVPAASLAILHKGEIAERIAIGADPETLFQAASISKVVTGVSVLRLVQKGKLTLDQPVTIVANSFDRPVTPRLLLSHRAGTNVPGFPGYEPGVPLPTLDQILYGTPPANTPAVRVTQMPGDAFRYSGGGTLVLQRLAMEAAAAPFDKLVAKLVLERAGLDRSHFTQPIPETVPNVAIAHGPDGKPMAGHGHVYPELGAAGLWSTAGELARLALAITADTTLLSHMATPVDNGPTGLGIFVHPRPGRPPILYHYGVNAGFRSVLAFAADASFGVTLMTNSEGGRGLIPAFCEPLFQSTGQGPFPPID